MDKALAKEFVKKVGPLEHSKDAKDRKAARRAEMGLWLLLASVPEPKDREARKRLSD